MKKPAFFGPVAQLLLSEPRFLPKAIRDAYGFTENKGFDSQTAKELAVKLVDEFFEMKSLTEVAGQMRKTVQYKLLDKALKTDIKISRDYKRLLEDEPEDDEGIREEMAGRKRHADPDSMSEGAWDDFFADLCAQRE